MAETPADDPNAAEAETVDAASSADAADNVERTDSYPEQAAPQAENPEHEAWKKKWKKKKRKR